MQEKHHFSLYGEVQTVLEDITVLKAQAPNANTKRYL